MLPEPYISVFNQISDQINSTQIAKTFCGRQTDRYFIDRNKSHYRLICHSSKRDICIYKNVSLLKSYTWYDKQLKSVRWHCHIKNWYFGNINDYFLK